MTDTLKVLGQITPAATTITTLYTVPAATQTTTSSLIVCNLSVSTATFNISVAIGGASDTPAQYIYSGTSLDASDTFVAQLGLSLAATDVVRVFASATGLSFNLFGVEIT